MFTNAQRDNRGDLLAALRDPDANVRREAIIELGALGDTRAVQPCIDALRDADEEVRRHAACALGNFGDARAVMPLIAAPFDEGVEVVGPYQ